MAEKQLTGSIELTKLVSVITTRKGKTGDVKGIFIPIDHNHLTEKDGRVFMDIRMIVRDEKDKYDQNGFISKGIPKEVYQENKDDKEKLKELQPILGNVKDWSAPSGGSSEPAPEVSEDEDLPF